MDKVIARPKQHIRTDGELMMPAKPFVCFWESLNVPVKERAEGRAEYVLTPINRYHEKAKKILELGCGIGEVLENLPEKYAVYGLDIKKDYIEVCKRRIRAR